MNLQARLQLEPADAAAPRGGIRYMPTVQNRPGELWALETASNQAWAGMTPLLQVVGPKWAEDSPSAASIRDWTKKLQASVGDHLFLLDVIRFQKGLIATHPTNSGPAINWLYEAARDRALNFVPVYKVGEECADILWAVRKSILLDMRGAALRYQPLNGILTSGASHESRLQNTLQSLDLTPEDTYLIIDLGWLDPESEIASSLLGDMVERLACMASWRDVIAIATSMPAVLSCVPEGTLEILPRHEWTLWSEISQRGLAVRYGDYCIQNPLPPATKGGNGMRANIRYTCSEGTLIARGEGPFHEEGKEQYIELCQKIKSRNEYIGPAYSPGDRRISDCASFRMDPGSQVTWRGAGTSHHIQWITDHLGGFGSAP